MSQTAPTPTYNVYSPPPSNLPQPNYTPTFNPNQPTTNTHVTSGVFLQPPHHFAGHRTVETHTQHIGQPKYTPIRNVGVRSSEGLISSNIRH